MMPTKFYLSGAITGHPTYKSDFARAEKYLQGLGFTVLNPAVLPVGLDEKDYMPICFAMLDAAEAICLIGDDWQESRGAMLEKAYAEYQGKKVFNFKDLCVIVQL